MDIMHDYVPAVKSPVITMVALFIVQTALVVSIRLFTDLKADSEMNTLVLGGIYFAFTICIWEIIIWAGIKTAKATQGSFIDGAIGGAMSAVIAGFIARVISIVFQVSTLPVLAAVPEPSSATAAWVAGILSISLNVIGLVFWFFIDLVGGAVLGAVGGIIHQRKLLDQMDRY